MWNRKKKLPEETPLKDIRKKAKKPTSRELMRAYERAREAWDKSVP